MATTTPTIRRTTTTRGWFAADSGEGGPVSLRALYAAYTACRRGKREARNTMAYESRLLDRLVDTRAALETRTWRPSRTLAFVVDKPKAREIHAADFGDRVVHHWLTPRLEEWFEPVFIHDSYSNRRGKGTHAAVERLGDFLRQVSRNGKVKAWYLQLDIANFFNSIDREILYGFIHRRAEKIWRAEKRYFAADAAPASPVGAALAANKHINHCLWLCRQLLRHDAGQDAIQRGSPASFARVPAHKRLKNAPRGTGLPIGNLTSQFFANVYLDALDQFVKHKLKCRHYLRYVDDFVLVHTDPAQLLAWRGDIGNFLRQRLGLTLKSLAEPCPTGEGVDFLGYLTRRTHVLPRRRVIRQIEAKLYQARREAVSRLDEGWHISLPPVRRESLRATVSSYLGYFSHAAAHRLTRGLWKRHGWMRAAFGLDTGHTHLVNLAEPGSASSASGQARFFQNRFPAFSILVQMGYEYALLTPGQKAQPLAGAARFHRADLPRIAAMMRRTGQPYALVGEDGYLKRGLKRRSLHACWWPDGTAFVGAASPRPTHPRTRAANECVDPFGAKAPPAKTKTHFKKPRRNRHEP
jgi:hypothetical protein